MTESRDPLEHRVVELEAEVSRLRQAQGVRGVRRRSTVTLGGLPLWEIAVGPDPERGELRGHARAVLAIGDMATGVIAVGGLARGGLAVGGLAAGGVAFGGAALGILAVGGAAAGVIAVGGAAAGYLACGGAAVGKYVISGTERSPEALAFFRSLPLLGRLIP